MKRLSLSLAALATPALAHPGDHRESGLLHLLTEPDHLALLAVVLGVAVFALVKYRPRR